MIIRCSRAWKDGPVVYEDSSFFQRTAVQFPALTGQLTTAYNSSFRVSGLQAVLLHAAQTYMQAKHPDTYKKLKKQEESSFQGITFADDCWIVCVILRGGEGAGEAGHERSCWQHAAGARAAHQDQDVQEIC